MRLPAGGNPLRTAEYYMKIWDPPPSCNHSVRMMHLPGTECQWWRSCQARHLSVAQVVRNRCRENERSERGLILPSNRRPWWLRWTGLRIVEWFKLMAKIGGGKRRDGGWRRGNGLGKNLQRKKKWSETGHAASEGGIYMRMTGRAGHLEDLDFAVPTFLSRRRRGSACFGDVKAKNEVGG